MHAHTINRSRDCDGEYSSGGVLEMTGEEKRAVYGDMNFQDRVVTGVISLHSHGTLTVTPAGAFWHEGTDEGYRETDIQWCSNNCEDTGSWQRDHSAEKAGY